MTQYSVSPMSHIANVLGLFDTVDEAIDFAIQIAPHKATVKDDFGIMEVLVND